MRALSVAHGRTPNDAIEKTPGRIVILDNAAPVRLLVESVAESLDTPRASEGDWRTGRKERHEGRRLFGSL